MPKASLTALLLQARDQGDYARGHEHECFALRSGLAAEQLIPFDLLGGPPTAADLRSCDMVLMGGAGHYYVSRKNLPHHDGLLDSINELVALGVPTFGSCFGYQLMVQAMGGEIIYDPERTEVGTFEVELSPEGEADPLFSRLPSRFFAQMGHKDRAIRHPEGVPNLASSALSPFQALRAGDAPIWATQFHPELAREDNIYRYNRYIEGYAADLSEAERQSVIDAHRPSPEANTLIAEFIDLVFA